MFERVLNTSVRSVRAKIVEKRVRKKSLIFNHIDKDSLVKL